MKKPEEIKKWLAGPIHAHYHPGDFEPRLTPRVMVDLEYMHADALALIQQLEAQVPRWISVEERLPDEGEKVIVRGMDGETQTGTYTGHSKLGKYLWWWTRNTYLKVSCWMPENALPEPPKEE